MKGDKLRKHWLRCMRKQHCKKAWIAFLDGDFDLANEEFKEMKWAIKERLKLTAAARAFIGRKRTK